MMTMQLDMTAQLAAILYGVAGAVGLSFVGILAAMGRNEMHAIKVYLVAMYRRSRTAVRRRLRVVPQLHSARGAH